MLSEGDNGKEGCGWGLRIINLSLYERPLIVSKAGGISRRRSIQVDREGGRKGVDTNANTNPLIYTGGTGCVCEK